jgi:hypothetical protein
MGRSAVWCGNGFQRCLIGSSLGKVCGGDETKLAGPKRGPHLAPPQTFICGRNRLVAQMGEIAPIQLKMVQFHLGMAKFQIFIK